MLVSLVLLVLVMRYGHVGKGAQRWIDLGGLQLQPSELMKIALVLALASWFHRASWERIGNPLFLIPPVDRGAGAGRADREGAQPRHGGDHRDPGRAPCSSPPACAGGSSSWWRCRSRSSRGIAYSHLHDYQRARIDTFLHPESDPLGAGYNIIQSKIALGSGGMWGKGFLQGTQGHLDFLPEKQTDFIFTMIGEEFGFVGGVAVLALLGLIVLGGMAIALRCRHQFGRLVAFGIAINFFLYVFVNIAMVMGAIPVGGVPLPLVSHGGSAMITVMIGFGVLMSVHVHRDVEFGEARNAA